jgi:hypothetical protein
MSFSTDARRFCRQCLLADLAAAHVPLESPRRFAIALGGSFLANWFNSFNVGPCVAIKHA